MVRASSRFSRIVAFISSLTSPLFGIQSRCIEFSVFPDLLVEDITHGSSRPSNQKTLQVFSSYFSASSWSSLCMIASMLRMSLSRLSSFPIQTHMILGLNVNHSFSPYRSSQSPFSGVLKIGICRGFSVSSPNNYW